MWWSLQTTISPADAQSFSKRQITNDKAPLLIFRSLFHYHSLSNWEYLLYHEHSWCDILVTQADQVTQGAWSGDDRNNSHI